MTTSSGALDSVLAAIHWHEADVDQLRQWTTDHLSLFDPRALVRLDGLVEQLSGPGNFLRTRAGSAGFEVEQIARSPLVPGDIRVQLLLFEVLELVASRLSDSLRQLDVLQRWAARLAELGILDDAHDRCQDALRLIQDRGLDDAYQADVLQQLAMIYQEAGLPRRAVTAFERVLAFDEQARDQLGIARSTGNLAEAWSAAGEYERAVQLHHAAIRRFMDCAEDPRSLVPAMRGAAVELLNTGLALERMNRAQDALGYLERSISTLRGLGSAVPDGLTRELATALLASARCSRQLGLPGQAQTAAAEAGRLAAQAGLPDLFEQALRLHED